MAGLVITERCVAGVTVLALHGPLAVDNGETTLRDYVNRLVAQGRVHIVLDVGHVTEFDSAGVGMLVAKSLSVCRARGRLTLVHLTTRIAYLLRVTRLSSALEIYESEDEAIRSFEPRPL